MEKIKEKIIHKLGGYTEVDYNSYLQAYGRGYDRGRDNTLEIVYKIISEELPPLKSIGLIQIIKRKVCGK